MRERVLQGRFGHCPRIYCEKQHVIPVGLSEDPKTARVKVQTKSQILDILSEMWGCLCTNQEMYWSGRSLFRLKFSCITFGGKMKFKNKDLSWFGSLKRKCQGPWLQEIWINFVWFQNSRKRNKQSFDSQQLISLTAIHFGLKHEQRKHLNWVGLTWKDSRCPRKIGSIEEKEIKKSKLN